MTARPTARQLIEATREHLQHNVLPTITDAKLRYQTLVAAHVLGVVERELEVGMAPNTAACDDFAALLGHDKVHRADAEQDDPFTQLETLERELVEAIRTGRFDAPAAESRLHAALVAQIEHALAIWNPGFLARVKG